ncbi:MAG: hypothetical protein QXV21_04660, partial [Candidatus Bathyarchaeia archaeon]
AHMLPAFMLGWLADYADIHNFAYPYAHSWGTVAYSQRYHNPTVDSLIEQGLYSPDGPIRQNIYYQIENIFYNEVPTVPLYVTVERQYMRDWVQGWYYNPLYPGIYAYNKWKWPMTTIVGTEGYFEGDMNYDGRVNFDDVQVVVDIFGAKGGLKFDPKWYFTCDFDDMPHYRWRNRQIDMGDIIISISRENWGKTSIPWHP